MFCSIIARFIPVSQTGDTAKAGTDADVRIQLIGKER